MNSNELLYQPGFFYDVHFTSPERRCKLLLCGGTWYFKSALKSLKVNKTLVCILHLQPPREKRESDWERNVPLWLNPRCSNRNQVPGIWCKCFPMHICGQRSLHRFRPDSIICFVIQRNNSRNTLVMPVSPSSRLFMEHVDPCKRHFFYIFMMRHSLSLFLLFFSGLIQSDKAGYVTNDCSWEDSETRNGWNL